MVTQLKRDLRIYLFLLLNDVLVSRRRFTVKEMADRIGIKPKVLGKKMEELGYILSGRDYKYSTDYDKEMVEEAKNNIIEKVHDRDLTDEDYDVIRAVTQIKREQMIDKVLLPQKPDL